MPDNRVCRNYLILRDHLAEFSQSRHEMAVDCQKEKIYVMILELPHTFLRSYRDYQASDKELNRTPL